MIKSLFPALVGLLCLHASGQTPEILGIFKFENNTPPDTAYEVFERFLGKKIADENLVPGLEARVWNLRFPEVFENEETKKANIRVAISGSFFSGPDSAVMLKFRIVDLKTGVVEEKSIPVAGMDQPDMAQIVVLKIKDILATGMLAKLNVSSTPLGLPITLNQAGAGVTPKEFFLPAGAYRLGITGQYLEPFETIVDINPGKSMTVSPEMEFKGYKTKYWLIGAIFATWEAAAFWKISNRYDKQESYNYIEFSMLTIAGIGWIGTGYCYFTNKSLKKRIFSLKN